MTDQATPAPKLIVIGLKFSTPPVWTGGHWHTYQRGQTDYRKWATDNKIPVDVISLQYQGSRALVNAGVVHIEINTPLPDDATEEFKAAYRGMETMLATIMRYVRDDTISDAPLVIQATLARAVADDIEDDINRPLDSYLSVLSGTSAIVTTTSSRRS